MHKNKLAHLSTGNNQVEKQESFGEFSSSNVNNIMMFILGKPFNTVYNVTECYLWRRSLGAGYDTPGLSEQLSSAFQ